MAVRLFILNKLNLSIIFGIGIGDVVFGGKVTNDYVIAAKDLSALQTVEDVLSELKKILNVQNVEINMCNNKFIDIVATDYPQKEFEVMIPESKLDDYIKGNKELRQLSYRTLIHKHFYENIDSRFPYQSLTLQQIGIPAYDVLQVSTEKGVFFVELSADRY